MNADQYNIYISFMDADFRREYRYNILESVKQDDSWRYIYKKWVRLYETTMSKAKEYAEENIRISCINETHQQLMAFCDMKNGNIIRTVEETRTDLFE